MNDRVMKQPMNFSILITSNDMNFRASEFTVTGSLHGITVVSGTTATKKL